MNPLRRAGQQRRVSLPTLGDPLVEPERERVAPPLNDAPWRAAARAPERRIVQVRDRAGHVWLAARDAARRPPWHDVDRPESAGAPVEYRAICSRVETPA